MVSGLAARIENEISLNQFTSSNRIVEVDGCPWHVEHNVFPYGGESGLGMAHRGGLFFVDPQLSHNVVFDQRVHRKFACRSIVTICITPGCNGILSEPFELIVLDMNVPGLS